MAVKQHVGSDSENDIEVPNESAPPNSMSLILSYVSQMDRTSVSHLKLCNIMVYRLALVQVPRTPEEIKIYRKEFSEMKTLFAAMCNENGNKSDIMISCLNIVYKLISDKDNVSSAVSVVLDVVPENIIPGAVDTILRPENSLDKSIIKVVAVLCHWLTLGCAASNLNIWIMAILKGLCLEHKHDVMLGISRIVIKKLFFNTLIPLNRNKVTPIVIFILSSTQYTNEVLNCILGDVRIVLSNLEKCKQSIDCSGNEQDVMDLVAFLVFKYPRNDGKYTEIETFFNNHPPSLNLKEKFKTETWQNQEEISLLSSNAKVGLVNLGNTCYMNSIIQSLLMTKQFSREILQAQIKTPMFVKVQQLFAALLYSDQPEFTPREFLFATRPIGFQIGHQQDSSEFLTHLLESLHEQEIIITGIGGPSISNNGTSHFVKVIPATNGHSQEETWDAVAVSDVDEPMLIDDENIVEETKLPPPLPIHKQSLEKTIVNSVFGGQISTTHKCLNCETSNENIDTFRDLHLSFPLLNKLLNSSKYAIQYLLDSYCSPEKLEDDNKYYCERCRLYCDGERHIKILRAPKNLILTLKYFKYDQKAKTRSKLTHKIDLNSAIDLVVTNEDASDEIIVKYNLFAAVIHSGYSMDGGHYYTYAADATSNTWYKFNDSFVSKTSFNELQNLISPNTPYILFYQMLSPPPDCE